MVCPSKILLTKKTVSLTSGPKPNMACLRYMPVSYELRCAPQALATVFNDDMFAPFFGLDRALARSGTADRQRGIPIDVVEVGPTPLPTSACRTVEYMRDTCIEIAKPAPQAEHDSLRYCCVHPHILRLTARNKLAAVCHLQKDKEFDIKADIPGVDKNDIKCARLSNPATPSCAHKIACRELHP